MATLTVFPGTSTPDATAEILRRAESQLVAYTKLAQFEARRRRALYDSYIAAGFTDEQSLQLIK